MPKYGNRSTIITSDDFYDDILDRRKVNEIRHYDVFEFSKKVIRSSYVVKEHVWSKGDKLYKIANKYYGDDEFWWIIALWNGKPTDAHYEFGTVVQVPFPPMRIYRDIQGE